MGRKKRQGEPNMDDDNDSTESCDENQNGFSCSHVAKGVDLSRVKKCLRGGLVTECPECERCGEGGESGEGGELEDAFELDLTLWLCLRCGHQGCSRNRRQHALTHFHKPHSDCHALCLNTSRWTVYCYECDNDVSPSSKKKLLEAVEYLKKQHSNNVVHKPIALDYPVVRVLPPDHYKLPNTTPGLDLPRVRGLNNLGNTCFFNAVMQCLGQTPFLQPLLEEMSEAGEQFTLPGGLLTPQEKGAQQMQLPEMEGELTRWGPLTRDLCHTLKELSSGKLEVLNPGALLEQLTLKQPQFGGGDQHDSHELLRHLLEAVRSEDLRRYQTVILKKLGLGKQADRCNVEGLKKQIVKFYGQQASDLMIRTDQVFRGVLVSTLQCQDCKHSSHRDEFFLDLSLPVVDKPVPPAYRRKSDAELMETESKPSKYQLKKEKLAARKARKQQHKTSGNTIIANAGASGNTIIEEQPADTKSDSDESDADIEDNIEECCEEAGGCEETGKGLESGYNSEKVSDASPELNAAEMDSGVTSPLTVTVPSPMCAEADSPGSGSGSSETNIQMPALVKTHFQNPEDYERPISRLSFTDKPTPMDVSMDKSMQEEEASRSEEPYRWTGTVSARYQCEEGECSVQSCLNQFTACEMMTGNNRVGCDNCTKQVNGAGGKTVYTNATKQLLISSPPAILILHLKRFQVAARCFPRKIPKHVPFPTLLDMAPFCSTRCRDLPSVHEEQSRILYSLYGIVEHSGGLHGGHYVAYVKVRPHLPADSYRWQFLSRPAASALSAAAADKRGAHGDPEPPPGKWYYVSDSHVEEVPEYKVLNAQAYLLFYERIL